ncbi:MAG: DUF503 domain-containing protein [Anaerolineales bacterium]|nr:DUF503 domain-containing protein [Anaerolineales bacterium]MCX7608209.1 DUF503 domain-containing protein [Anaerolineales bacterium]MDW8227030.1 DUF503 domain-containing protein [Anaerolineales bacterium]
MVGTLLLHLLLPGCVSLKEKRSRLKPFLHRLHREFNLSVAETDLQDHWQEAIVLCAMAGNGRAYLESALETVSRWSRLHWEGEILEAKIEIL